MTIKYIALDFDLTLTTVHTGMVPEAVDNPHEHCRKDMCRELIKILNENKIKIAVTTFHQNHDLVKRFVVTVLGYNLPVICGTPNFLDAGKSGHIACAFPNAKPQEILIIDDSEVNVRVAVAEGMKYIWVNDGMYRTKGYDTANLAEMFQYVLHGKNLVVE